MTEIAVVALLPWILSFRRNSIGTLINWIIGVVNWRSLHACTAGHNPPFVHANSLSGAAYIQPLLATSLRSAVDVCLDLIASQ